MAVILLFLVQSHMLKLLLTSIYSYSRTTYFGNLWYDMYMYIHSIQRIIPLVERKLSHQSPKFPFYHKAKDLDTGEVLCLVTPDGERTFAYRTGAKGEAIHVFLEFVAEAQEQISLNLQISSIPLFTLFMIHSIRKVSLLVMPLGLNHGIRCKNDRRGLWLASGQRLVWSNRCCSLQLTVGSLLETCCRPRFNTKYI